jgi:hypothetical protein
VANYNTITNPGTSVVEFGQVFVTGDLGLVMIGEDIFGGTGTNAAELRANGTLARIIVRGSIVGGSGVGSAEIFGQALGFAGIGGDLIGGSVNDSGAVFSDSNLDRVILGGSLMGVVTIVEGLPPPTTSAA